MATPFATGKAFQVAAVPNDAGQRIATLANGSVAIVYERAGVDGGPKFVLLDQDSILFNQAAASPFLPTPVTAGAATNGNVSVAALPAGGFLLGSSGPSDASEARLYVGATLADTLNLPGALEEVRVATLTNGDMVVGRKSGGDFFVNVLGKSSLLTISHGADTDLEIASLQDGGFVVAGIDTASNSGDPTYFIRNADGSARGSGLSTTNAGTEAETFVFGLKNNTNNGNFVSVFTTKNGLDGQGDGVLFVIHTPTDNNVSPSLKLANTTTAGDQSEAAGVGLADGRFVIVWVSDVTGTLDGTGEVRAQLFNADGSKNGVEFLVGPASSNCLLPQVAEMTDGRLIFTWQEVVGSAIAVEARVFDPREAGITRAGTELGDQYVGTIFTDVLNGANGNDFLWGNSGVDTLNGGNGADVLLGERGNDILRGGAANDVLKGGLGRDIMSGGIDSVRDVFDFNAVGETGKTATTRDWILDFKHLIDDIDLKTIDANGSAAGTTAFSFLAAKGAAFTGVKGQLHWFQQNSAGTVNDKTIVEGDTNGDRVADFAIEMRGLITLTAADFIL